ncbi:MAG: hypothetical protein WD529_07340 [Balneolaceae bacterium]
MKRALFLIVITVLIILTGMFIWLRYGVDQDQIQSMVADALGPDYNVEINSARIFPLQRAISIGHIEISSSIDDRIIFRTDTLHISGMSPKLFFRKNIILSKVRMDTFTFDWNTSKESSKGDSSSNDSVKKVGIESLDLTNGTIISRKDGRANKQINDLNLNAGFLFEFTVEPDSMNSPQYSMNIDSLGFLYSEDRYRLSLSGFNLEHQDSLMTLSSMKLIPVGGFNQFMSTLEFDADMFEIELENFTASGIDPDAYYKQNIIKARSLDVDTFHLHVSKDKQLPKHPDKKNPTLLNESIQNLPFAIQLDSLSFRNTNIQYSEQHKDGARPGTISFMNSTIHIRNVNSRSPSPAILNAVTYLQNHSELNTELNFTLDDSQFHLTGSGDLKPFELIQLNSIFMDLSGVEVLSGNVHELNFDIEMLADTSSGRMHFVYEDLKLDLIDKDDYHVSFTNSIISFLANNIAVRSDNLADSSNEVRTGEIGHTHEPEAGFFKYLWHSLRSGIYDIVLRV